MKSRMLNSIVVLAILVVLAIPTMIAAQTEQERGNNQSNKNVVKNLDKRESTSTIAECIADPSSGIADKHAANSGANTMMDDQPGNPCFQQFDPKQCPPGATPRSPGGSYYCSFRNPIVVDWGRLCPIFSGHAHCEVDPSTHKLNGWCPLP